MNDVKSQPIKVASGVPHVSVLRPLLFLILISDINEEVSESFGSSFADYTRIVYPIIQITLSNYRLTLTQSSNGLTKTTKNSTQTNFNVSNMGERRTLSTFPNTNVKITSS